MVLDLKRLFQGDGGEETAVCQLDFTGVELGGAKPFCAPVRVQVWMKAFAGAVDFRAQVCCTLSMPCDRCAEPVVRTCFWICRASSSAGRTAKACAPCAEKTGTRAPAAAALTPWTQDWRFSDSCWNKKNEEKSFGIRRC